MVFFSKDWGIFVAVWGDDFAAVGGDEGIRKLDALLEANLDKKLEAVVGPKKDVQGKILNRIIAYNAERKSFEWHTDGKHPKKIGEMLNFNDRTKGANMTGTKDDGAKLRDGALELDGAGEVVVLLCRGSHALPRVGPPRYAVCNRPRHAVRDKADCWPRRA